jgi:hypothetical protein
MEIELTGRVAEIIKEKVAAEGYPDAAAFIADIVLHADEFDRLKLERLRQEVNIGLDEIKRAAVVEFDIDDILDEETK